MCINKCRILIAKNMTFMEVTQYELIPKILFTSSVTEGPSKMPRMIQKRISVEIYRVVHVRGMKN